MSLAVTIARRWPAAEGIMAFELRSPAGDALPPFRAGAHVDLHLPGGGVRQYSLLGDEARRDHYVIAVQHEPAGRGGSAALHALPEGTRLTLAPPRNSFDLVRDEAPVLLVAGGIGITPLLSMACALRGRGDVHLHYAARSLGHIAFRDELAAGAFGRVTLYGPDAPVARLDPARLAADAAPGTRLYLCGPARFMRAVTEAFGDRPDVEIRTEHFAAPGEATPPPADAFGVTLARTGLSLTVAPGRTILDELRGLGLDPLVSCEQGVCGTCATRVLSGAIEHCDYVLSPPERAKGDCMMICVSRGKPGTTLVLDL